MTGFQALILGIVQGLTEFLPVSSSGHLVIFRSILGAYEAPLLFDVMLHLGTVVAVVIAYREDLGRLIAAFFAPRSLGRTQESRYTVAGYRRMFFLLIISCIPTVILALILKPLVEATFSSVGTVGWALLITGTFLLVSERFGSERASISRFPAISAFIVGIAQGIAAFPGISRSGATIGTSLLLGLRKEEAARYSFILSIPVIIGAALLELKDLLGTGVGGGLVAPMVIGVISAAVSGYIAIRMVLLAFRKRRFSLFAIYCWIVGGLIIFGRFIAQ